MKIFIHAYFRIAAFCVLFTLTVQGWVIKVLYESPNIALIPKYIIVLLGSAGTYFLLYKVAVNIYEKWIWRIIYRQLYIGGRWYHIIESEMEPDYIRFGITQIRQTMFDINIRGINYDKEFTFSSRSLWDSRAVSMDDNGRLIFTYQVSRAGQEDPKEKTGIMIVHLHYENGRSPMSMEGIFQDSLPGKKRGSITWKREVPWQDRIRLHELEEKGIEDIAK